MTDPAVLEAYTPAGVQAIKANLKSPRRTST